MLGGLHASGRYSLVYFHALKVVGVPVKLVRFNDEYHGTGSKPSSFMRTQLLMMRWYMMWGGEKSVAEDGDAAVIA